MHSEWAVPRLSKRFEFRHTAIRAIADTDTEALHTTGNKRTTQDEYKTNTRQMQDHFDRPLIASDLQASV